MSFQAGKTDEFLAIFHSAKEQIRAMPGCRYLSLHRDHHHAHVFYTLSKWDSQEALDGYRQTELFASTWAATRVLFDDKPQAHSLEEEVVLD